MKTFAELEQAKAEGKACENCAWRYPYEEKLFCLNYDTHNNIVPKHHCCRGYSDTLPENLQEDETRTILV